jgi:hypothetical protein
VAQLRMEAAKYPEDPRLIALVGELSTGCDEQFAQWWGDHRVAAVPWVPRPSITPWWVS